MTDSIPSPHGDKLRALMDNTKLPDADRDRVHETINIYDDWRRKLLSIKGDFNTRIETLVDLLNTYKLYLDLDLIFDSPDDFLYRQKGQLKLDNTVIEEFLALFFNIIFNDKLEEYGLKAGPDTCFASVYFSSSMTSIQAGGGLNIRRKDQDFVISRPLYLRTSHDPDFTDARTERTNIAYVAMECKTNLDKTMFQEAAATALDLKTGVPTAKYYLLCDWLDMTPISSSTTAIDEVIILRKAKRLSSHIRKHFSTAAGRRVARDDFEAYLLTHPYSPDTFLRIANHVSALIDEDSEDAILSKGHF